MEVHVDTALEDRDKESCCDGWLGIAGNPVTNTDG